MAHLPLHLAKMMDSQLLYQKKKRKMDTRKNERILKIPYIHSNTFLLLSSLLFYKNSVIFFIKLKTCY